VSIGEEGQLSHTAVSRNYLSLTVWRRRFLTLAAANQPGVILHSFKFLMSMYWRLVVNL